MIISGLRYLGSQTSGLLLHLLGIYPAVLASYTLGNLWWNTGFISTASCSGLLERSCHTHGLSNSVKLQSKIPQPISHAYFMTLKSIWINCQVWLPAWNEPWTPWITFVVAFVCSSFSGAEDSLGLFLLEDGSWAGWGLALKTLYSTTDQTSPKPNYPFQL